MISRSFLLLAMILWSAISLFPTTAPATPTELSVKAKFFSKQKVCAKKKKTKHVRELCKKWQIDD
jgi:hypothetical protein